MMYACRVFIGKSTHAVWVAVFIAFAFLVIFNGPVEAFSFPEGQLLTHQGDVDIVELLEIGGQVVSRVQECEANRFYQVVELSSSVPIDGKPIADKVSNKDSYESKCDAFCETHCRLLINIIFLLGGFTMSIFLRCFLLH